MAGFNARPVLSTQADGLFNAAAEASATVPLTPGGAYASITFVKVGAVTSFEFCVYGSCDGVTFAPIDGYDAVTVEGLYKLGGPMAALKVVMDACTLGAGTSVLVNVQWVYQS